MTMTEQTEAHKECGRRVGGHDHIFCRPVPDNGMAKFVCTRCDGWYEWSWEDISGPELALMPFDEITRLQEWQRRQAEKE